MRGVDYRIQQTEEEHDSSTYETKARTTHTSSKRPLNRLARIDWSSRLLGSHVRVTAGNVFAGQTRETRQIVIETIQPHGTIVRRQGPFPNNDRTEFTLHLGNDVLLAACVSVKVITRRRVIPRLVNVSIQSTTRATEFQQRVRRLQQYLDMYQQCQIIHSPSHEASPYISSESKRVMYNVSPVRSVLLHNEVAIPVKLFQFLNGSVFPGFVDGLQPENSWMTGIRCDNFLNNFQGVLDIVVVDFRIVNCLQIKLAHPLGRSNGPVFKRDNTCGLRIQFSGPLKALHLSRVVESILRSLHGVNVK